MKYIKNIINFNNWINYDDKKYVTDYKGNKIPKNESVWCFYGSVYCHEDEAWWSESEGEYVIPNHEDFYWDSYKQDYMHVDDLL